MKIQLRVFVFALLAGLSTFLALGSAIAADWPRGRADAQGTGATNDSMSKNLGSDVSDEYSVNATTAGQVAANSSVLNENDLMEVDFLIKYKERPVTGAMVHPEFYGGLGGNEFIGVDPKETNDKGVASFRLKKPLRRRLQNANPARQRNAPRFLSTI